MYSAQEKPPSTGLPGAPPSKGTPVFGSTLAAISRQIGSKRALGMILTGRHVSAAEGHELGFINEVVPHDELMERTMVWVNQILACSPLSLRASKDVVYRSLDTASLRESMEADYETVKKLVKSDDFIEGPKAFAEKRAPNWSGH